MHLGVEGFRAFFLLYFKFFKTFMLFPLYLYSNPIEFKQFPFILRIFPSIRNYSHVICFTFLLTLVPFCLIIASKIMHMGFFGCHCWCKFEKCVLKKSQIHLKVSKY